MVNIVFFVGVGLMAVLAIRGIFIASNLKKDLKLNMSPIEIVYLFNNGLFSGAERSLLNFKDNNSINIYKSGVKNSRFMFLVVLVEVVFIFLMD